MWGAVFSTAPVMNAGAHCVWGPTWAPTEGHVVMPLRATKGSFVALRVLDYDFGKKDDVLGECFVDVDALLAAQGLTTLPLYRRQGLVRSYGPQLVNGQPSVITLCAMPEAADEALKRMPPEFGQGARRVRICLVSANNLRAADMFGGNDVYCRLWEIDAADAQPGKPLPDPPARVTMPQARQLTFPFTFQLPMNMPSTLEQVPGVDYGFIRCSVYAHLDIAWRLNPSVRAYLSIVQPVIASLPRLLMPVGAAGSKPMYGVHCGCCCECCLSCFGAGCCENKSDKLGDVALEASLARSGMAPGELVPFTRLRAVNGTERLSVLRIQFVRFFALTAYALPGRNASECVYTVFEAPVPAGGDVSLTPEVIVPLLSPDYHGWGDTAPPYPPQFRSWGTRWTRHDEPIRWRTVLRVTLDTPGTPFDLQHDLPVFIAALPPAPSALPPPLPPMAAPSQWQYMDQAAAEAEEARTFFARVSADELRAAGVDLAVVASSPPRMAAQEGVFAQNPEEDCKCDPDTLTFAPTYFVVVSPTPRIVASPYAGVPVDVSGFPPGSVVTCPQTQMQFTVPYWGEPERR